jgi:hypothetical protein
MSRRRRASAVTAVAVVGGLTALLASCASPATGTREPAGAAGTPVRQAARISPLANAQFATPPVNPAWYQACVIAVSEVNTSTSAENASAYITGWADAGKLRESLPTGYPDIGFASAPGGTEGLFPGEGTPTVGNDSLMCYLTTVQLDYNGLRELPPIRVSTLAFGFEPVTATATLQQVGAQPVSTWLIGDLGEEGDFTNGPITAVTIARLRVQLTDVKVNGVPLNVGNSCHSGILTSPDNSIAPGELVETGNASGPLPAWTNVFSGGATAADADIPPFTGCVTPTGENLDALLTATVSGPGNYVQTSVGPVCIVATGCFAGENKPKFPAPLISITHGGRYSSTASFSLSGNVPLSINCANSAISGEFPNAEGPPRGPFASMELSDFSGCTGSDGSQWQISQAGTADFSVQKYSRALGYWNSGQVGNMTLDLTGTGTGAPGNCYAVVSGYTNATYTNDPAVLAMVGSQQLYVTQSSCPDLPLTGLADNYEAMGAVASYSLAPSDITVLPMVLPTP